MISRKRYQTLDPRHETDLVQVQALFLNKPVIYFMYNTEYPILTKPK